MQNLHYTYDPAGNITHIRDDAQQTIYFRNQRVEPSADYTYDAIYRLIEATGREHLGQIGWRADSALAQRRATRRHRLAHPATAMRWAPTPSSYVYDAVGNFLADAASRQRPGPSRLDTELRLRRNQPDRRRHGDTC